MGNHFWLPVGDCQCWGQTDKLASLYSSHPVLLDFSLLLIVKKELADLTLTQETFSKYLEGVTTIDSTQAVIMV